MSEQRKFSTGDKVNITVDKIINISGVRIRIKGNTVSGIIVYAVPTPFYSVALGEGKMTHAVRVSIPIHGDAVQIESEVMCMESEITLHEDTPYSQLW